MSRHSPLRRATRRSCSALALLLASASGPVMAQAFQGAPSLDFGSATIDAGTPGVHTITVDTPRATITWTPSDTGTGGGPIDFLPNGNTVNYVANGALGGNYTILNRILPVDSARSVAFNGTVNSDAAGSIWFYSPGGLLIGSTARINVGSLMLTASDLVVDGSNDFMPTPGQFSVAGVNGSTSAIEVQAGAEIRAENAGQSNYVVAVAPRIQQDGLISTRGSAALVAAESVDFAVDALGLFTISVQQGSTVSGNTLTHSGSTGGPDAAGVGEVRRVYMLAVPKNNAVTMAIQSGGSIGFDVAGAADLDGNAIVLSAGHDIADIGIGNPIDPIQSGIGTADIVIARGQYTSNTYASALNDAVVEDLNFTGTPDIAFASNLWLHAASNAAVRAQQGLVSIGGDLTIDTRTPFNGAGFGEVAVTAPGAAMTVAGNLVVTAADIKSSSGFASAGNARILLNGGTLAVGGTTVLEALAQSADNPFGTADLAFAGQALVDLSGGASFTTNGDLILSADAVGGIGGDGTGDYGGDAYAGSARIILGNGGEQLTVGGGILMNVGAIGGDAGNTNGSGGVGEAGTVDVLAIGGTIEGLTGGLEIAAVGLGGSGAFGGNALGGNVSVITNNGTISTTGDFGISIDASAQGGDANGISAFAGDAIGGNIILETRGASGGFDLNIGGGLPSEPYYGIALSSVAFGGIGSNSGSTGGSALGGAIRLATTGAGQAISVQSAEGITIATTAYGGDSIDNAGGDAFGGMLDVQFLGGGGQITAGGLSLFTDAIGGTTSISGQGKATSGAVSLRVSNGASLDVAGNLRIVAQAETLSGNAASDATANNTLIDAFGGSLTVNGTSLIDVSAMGGGSLTGPGGFANAGSLQMKAGGGATVQLVGGVTVNTSAVGGGAMAGNGGDATAGGSLVTSKDSQVRLGASGGGLDFDTSATAGAGTTAGNATKAGLAVETVNNGYAALGGAGSGATGNIEIAGPVNGLNGLTLELDAARNILVHMGITTSAPGASIRLRADAAGTGSSTVTFNGGSTLALTGASSRVEIYHNPTAIGSPTDYSANVSGAQLDSYQLLHTIDALQLVGSYLDQNFALGRDIDATLTGGWNGGAGFVPIGTDGFGGVIGSGFTGKFDGLGHSISGLTINRAASLVGLFGMTTGAEMRNLGLLGGSIAGNSNTGGLIGYANGGVFTNLASSARVFSDGGDVGGLIGHLDGGGQLIASFASGEVTNIGGTFSVGGLVGYNNGVIAQSWATGNVTLDGDTRGVGGLVGFNDGIVAQSYATGDVTGGTLIHGVGGLVGYSRAGSVSRSYATGNVTGVDAVGGLVGYIEGGSISQNWASGAVSGSSNVGGFVGNAAGGGVSNSYWDSFSTGRANGVGGGGGAVSNLLAVTSDPQQSGGLNYAFDSASYGLFTPADWTHFENGSRPIGTWEAPVAHRGAFHIRSAHQVQLVERHLHGTYQLRNDIDMNETARLAGVWGDFGLTPLGNSDIQFEGVFAGKGHVLSNLSINQMGFGDTGLFGMTRGTITDLGLVNATVQAGSNNAGVLAGFNEGLISGSFATGTLSTSGPLAGGLVGLNGNLGTITQSYASVGVSGASTAGGLAGINDGTISFSFADGTVSGSTVGGLIGTNTTQAQVTSSYWNVETSGLAQMCGMNSGSGCLDGNGLTTAQTRQASSFAGWSIDAVGDQPNFWRIYNGASGPLLKSFLRRLPVQTGNVAVQYDGTVPLVFVIPAGADIAHIFGTPLVNGAGSDVGTYAISYGGGLSSDQLGYDIVDTGVGGVLTITPAPLLVTADPTSRLYGDPNPSFTYVASGLIGADTLTGALASLADVTSPIGAYAIDLGTLDNPNYAISFVGANLTILARPIIVTADSLGRIYGDANPALTYTVGGSGLVNGDTLAGALAASADATSAVGSYAIGQGTLANGNYAISFTGGTLGVTARPITVTADSLSRIYGDANPALTYTVGGSGLVNGDTLGGSLVTSADATSAVGSYAIGQGTLANGNYAISFTGGTLGVTARPITVTADSLSRPFGDANPPLTYTVGGSGLVNGDTLSGGLATSAVGASPAGQYAITQGSLSASSNYALSYVEGSLTVQASTSGGGTGGGDTGSGGVGEEVSRKIGAQLQFAQQTPPPPPPPPPPPSQQQGTKQTASQDDDPRTPEEQRRDAREQRAAARNPRVLISNVIDTSAFNQTVTVNEPVSGAGNSALWGAGGGQ